MENYIVFIILFVILLILVKFSIEKYEPENYSNINKYKNNSSKMIPSVLSKFKSDSLSKIRPTSPSKIRPNSPSKIRPNSLSKIRPISPSKIRPNSLYKIRPNSPSKIRLNSPSKMITQDQLTAHNAKALVLTCMDFRLIDDSVDFMNIRGYHNNYDEFILAGASLGYNQETYPQWKQLLNKHIDLAKELHDISEIVVIDHMKCGAYKLFYNKELTEKEEFELHLQNLKLFKETINNSYPELKVYTYLMELDGTSRLIN